MKQILSMLSAKNIHVHDFIYSPSVVSQTLLSYLHFEFKSFHTEPAMTLLEMSSVKKKKNPTTKKKTT